MREAPEEVEGSNRIHSLVRAICAEKRGSQTLPFSRYTAVILHDIQCHHECGLQDRSSCCTGIHHRNIWREGGDANG